MSRGTKWTTEEEKLLRAVWPTDMTVYDTAALFPTKSYGALVKKAVRMGLTKVRPCYREPKATSEDVSELFYAWLAGMIDGEGCIGLYKSKASVCARIAIANTHLPTLLSIKETLGAGYVARKNPKEDNTKVGYTYGLSDRRILKAVLNSVLPHLRVKKAQAVLLQEFLTRPGSDTVQTEFTTKTMEKLAALNLRGVSGGNKDLFAKEYDEYRNGR